MRKAIAILAAAIVLFGATGVLASRGTDDGPDYDPDRDFNQDFFELE